MGQHMRLAALLAVMSLLAGGCSLAGGGNNEFQIEFARVFNLFPGSPVRVLGIEVGKVVDVEAEPGRDTAVATVTVDGDVELPADVNAHIIQGALLGERIVELDPPYTGGPVLEPGATVPTKRTTEPAEFDEVLESLNDFLDDLPPDEVARLVRNAAGTLDGLGDDMGRALESAAGAVGALQHSDEDIVALSSRLADLNQTLATRDDEIASLVRDWGALVGVLQRERDRLDMALGETARMTTELKGLLNRHADDLEVDVEAVTRLGRTLGRNLSEIDLLLEGQSELYRHADRIMNREKNWLPLVNHDESLGDMFAERLENRLVGLCDRLEIAECADPEFWEGEVPDEVCLPPLLSCGGGGDGGGSGLPSEPPSELPSELPTDLPGGELPGGTARDGQPDGGGSGGLDLPAVRLGAAAPAGGDAASQEMVSAYVVLARAMERVPELADALREDQQSREATAALPARVWRLR